MTVATSSSTHSGELRAAIRHSMQPLAWMEICAGFRARPPCAARLAHPATARLSLGVSGVARPASHWARADAWALPMAARAANPPAVRLLSHTTLSHLSHWS